MVLRSLGKSLTNTLNKLTKSGPVDKKLILTLKNEIFASLLEADVSLDIANDLCTKIESRSFSEELPTGLERKKAVINIVYEELVKIMGDKTYKLNLKSNQVNIIITVGIQGSGKTTSVGKLANYLKKQGWKLGLVCVDNWRPGAYEQLNQLGKQLDVEVYGDQKINNPIKLAKNGIKTMIKAKKTIIIIDTAGRHSNEKSMIKEMSELNKVINPNEVILVIDGTSGNQIYKQAATFAQVSNLGSIFVTKLDGTAKGGGAITAAAAARVPIKFIGVGENLDDIEEYNPKKTVGTLLGLGDIDLLLEEVKQANLQFSTEQTKSILKGRISYTDILNMYESMGSPKSFRKILDLMPGGLSHKFDDSMLNLGKENMKQFKAMVSSMTDAEKNVDVKLNYTRIKRIAKGSGLSEMIIKKQINQKRAAERMIKRLKPGRKGKANNMGLPFDLGNLM